MNKVLTGGNLVSYILYQIELIMVLEVGYLSAVAEFFMLVCLEHWKCIYGFNASGWCIQQGNKNVKLINY